MGGGEGSFFYFYSFLLFICILSDLGGAYGRFVSSCIIAIGMLVFLLPSFLMFTPLGCWVLLVFCSGVRNSSFVNLSLAESR